MEHEIRRRIRQNGPIRVDDFMSLVLGHPEHGYYRTRDPLGSDGDFTTAPEISQVFGELIGLWAAVIWEQLGRPAPFTLAELGPGRGTMMSDALRAAHLVDGFRAAAETVLVETGPILRRKQSEALAGADPRHVDGLDQIPPGPMILVANEFFDALPVRQIVYRAGVWRERRIALDGATDALAFIDAESVAAPSIRGVETEDGDIVELSPDGERTMSAIAARIAEHGGAALIVDYGHVRPGVGETLQAVKAHRYHDPLREIGTADLTAHVDFAALAAAARRHLAGVHGPVTQKDFLIRLGIEPRTEALAGGGTPEQALLLRTGTRRLIDPSGMGTLFKAMAVTSSAAVPPGFEDGEEVQ